MATTRKKKEPVVVSEPVVVKGNHLTVTTYPNGRTELKWDDDALLEEVRTALASVEGKENGNKTRKTRKSK